MESSLQGRIAEIRDRAGFTAVAVAVHDYETGTVFSEHGERSFHAASVIKLAILVALFKAARHGSLRLDDPLHVRNRFRSIVDGSVYRIDRERDADALVHQPNRPFDEAVTARARDDYTQQQPRDQSAARRFLGVVRCASTLGGRVKGVKVVRGVEDRPRLSTGHQQ